MKSLSIENSSPHGSLAVADDRGTVLARRDFQGAGELAVQVEQMFLRFRSFEEIVVGIGPGSYTGIRVAVSLTLGLKMATRCQVFGCASIFGFEEDSYAVIGDARRGTFFLAALQDAKILVAPQLVPVAELGASLGRLPAMPIFSTTSFPESLPADLRTPKAEYLFRRRPHFEPLSEPIYLKPPHVTKPAGS